MSEHKTGCNKLNPKYGDGNIACSCGNELIEQLQAKNKRLKEVIEGALKISDLWTLKEVETMFEDEAKALESMRQSFEQALKGGE
jgi:hypothetical protein